MPDSMIPPWYFHSPGAEIVLQYNVMCRSVSDMFCALGERILMGGGLTGELDAPSGKMLAIESA